MYSANLLKSANYLDCHVLVNWNAVVELCVKIS